jgi:hypothetical protein
MVSFAVTPCHLVSEYQCHTWTCCFWSLQPKCWSKEWFYIDSWQKWCPEEPHKFTTQKNTIRMFTASKTSKFVYWSMYTNSHNSFSFCMFQHFFFTIIREIHQLLLIFNTPKMAGNVHHSGKDTFFTRRTAIHRSVNPVNTRIKCMSKFS